MGPRVRLNELHCACAVNFPKNVKRSSAPPPKFLLLATRLMFNAERLSINDRDRDSIYFRTLYSAVWTLSLVTTAVGWPGPGCSAFVSRNGGQERRPACGVASGASCALRGSAGPLKRALRGFFGRKTRQTRSPKHKT